MNTETNSGTLAPIRESIVIDRPIDTVWRRMTDEASVPLWLGCLRYRKEIGALFYMQQDQAKARADDINGATHCEIMALDAPNLFKFSWFLPDFPKTFVSFRLEADGAQRTRVGFTHEGWDQFPADAVKMIYDALSSGWKSFVLPGLKRTAES